MTNNKQPLKGLQGESKTENITVDEAANISAHLHFSVRKIQNISFAMETYEDGFKNGANWQAQHPTEKESATVDEIAERLSVDTFRNFIRANHLTAKWEEFITNDKAAYNMRDKEQAVWITNEYPNDVDGKNDERIVLIRTTNGGKHLGYCSTTMRVPDSLEIIWLINGIGVVETDEVYGWMELPE